MKSLPPGLQDHLSSGATTLCWCWRLQRKDGVTAGFTDHDGDVVFGGLIYRAATGFTAGEVQSALGLSVDNLTVIGALSAAALTESDLAAGLYDDAGVEIWRVNWQDPAQRVLMRAGNLGEVSRGKLAFEAEMRGLAHKLNQTVGRAYLRNCDAVLGDGRCTVSLATPAYNGTGAVVSLLTEGRVFTVSGLDAFAAGWFANGKLSWTSGANAGRAMEVKAHGKTGSAVTLELWQQMSAPVAPGDAFAVTAGCDKTQAVCIAKFNNIANFRGFPLMPGNDAVIAYPSRGEGTNDGGSRFR